MIFISLRCYSNRRHK